MTFRLWVQALRWSGASKVMFMISRRFLLTSLIFLAGSPSHSWAEEVSSHDFTVEKSVETTIHAWMPNGESCPESDEKFIKTACGSLHPPLAGQISLTIDDVFPRVLSIGEKFEISVRVTNSGTVPTRIPWWINGTQALEISDTGRTASQEEASISLELETKGQANWLIGSAALYAEPSSTGSWIELQPGQWVTLKFSGQIACENSALCKSIVPDKHAALRAEWFEYRYTRSVHQCDPNESNATSRVIKSRPVKVTIGKNVRPS